MIRQSVLQSAAKRGSKKVRPIYEDNSDCVLLYACGWQEYTSLPSNSHIKYNCGGGEAAGCCSGADTAGCGGCGSVQHSLSVSQQIPYLNISGDICIHSLAASFLAIEACVTLKIFLISIVRA